MAPRPLRTSPAVSDESAGEVPVLPRRRPTQRAAGAEAEAGPAGGGARAGAARPPRTPRAPAPPAAPAAEEEEYDDVEDGQGSGDAPGSGGQPDTPATRAVQRARSTGAAQRAGRVRSADGAIPRPSQDPDRTVASPPPAAAPVGARPAAAAPAPPAPVAAAPAAAAPSAAVAPVAPARVTKETVVKEERTPRRPVGAVGREVLARVAQVAQLVFLVLALLVIVGLLFVLSDANLAGSGIVRFFVQTSSDVAGPFKTVFTADGKKVIDDAGKMYTRLQQDRGVRGFSKKAVIENWGLAAVVYLVLGSLVRRVLGK